jgi:hypothetical protein
MYSHVFVHLSMDGHPGWIHNLGIVTNAQWKGFADISLIPSVILRSAIAESYDSSNFSLLKNLHTNFHRCGTNLHYHQQCRRGHFSLTNIVFSLMIAILTWVRWNLVVALICLKILTIFSFIYWPFILL